MDKAIRNIRLKKIDLSKTILLISVVMFVCVNVLQLILGNILELQNGFVNLMGYFSVGFPLLLLIATITKLDSLDKTDISNVLLLLYQTIIAIIGILNADNIKDITLLARYISTTTFPVVLYVMGRNNFGKNIINFLFCANTIMSILFIVLYFSDKAYKFNGVVGSYPLLTLNFSNPNLTAMVLLGNLGVLLLSFNHYKSIPLKVIFLSLAGVIFYFLYLTNSRLSFGVGILLCICIALNFRVKKWHIIIVILLPVVFFVLYNLLYSIESLRDVVIMGKPLFSGRIELWQNILNTFNQSAVNIFFGDFSTFQLLNAHNGPLSQLVSYGVIGVMLYFSNLYFQIQNIAKNCGKNRAMNNALYIVFSSLMLMIAEAGVVTNGGIITVFVVIAVAYIKYAETKEKEQPKFLSNLKNDIK